jgi:hypothetical protein
VSCLTCEIAKNNVCITEDTQMNRIKSRSVEARYEKMSQSDRLYSPRLAVGWPKGDAYGRAS